MQNVEILDRGLKFDRRDFRSLRRWNIRGAIRIYDDMKFGLGDRKLVEIQSAALKERSKVQSDIDPRDMSKRRAICRLQASKRQVLESDSLLPETPGEAAESDLRSSSPFDFLDDEPACALFERRRVEVNHYPPDSSDDQNDDNRERGKNPPPS